MKRLSLITLLLTVSLCSFAQSSEDMMKEFEKYRESIYSNYKNYLGEINAQYEQFLRAAWKGFEAEEPIPEPAPEPEPEPVVMDDPKPVIEDNRIEVTPIEAPKPEPAPTPVVKVEETPVVVESRITIPYYGANVALRFNKNSAPHIKGTDENSVADFWHDLCGGCCNNLLKDLFDQRKNRDLCDWAYYELCKKTASAMSANANEREVLTAFLLCQSGFKVKMGRDRSNRLYTLLATNSALFDRPYWVVNGTSYYMVEKSGNVGQLYIMQNGFPEEKALRLEVTSANRFDVNASQYRTLVSERYPNVKARVQTNKNLMDFYNTYPTSYAHDNVMTRWSFYAMSPMDETCKKTLYPQLREAMKGRSEKEKVECLLNFVQTAFVYEYDDKVWGEDRAFFSEETLYYPYCDCEDRSIFFSRLVRDLVGLDVALVFYPGHLATAVAFTNDVRGDYMVINGRRFTVCDPTYINAPVGLTMRGMDNSSAKVIVLKH